MKSISLVTILFLCYTNVHSQKGGLKTELYKLESEIIDGNIESLKALSVYLDDTSFVQEFLGHHNYPNTAEGIAKRIISENCLFTKSEFRLDSSVTASSFLQVLENNNVVFEQATGMYLITPLEKRKTIYLLKELTKAEIDSLDSISSITLQPEWQNSELIEDLLRNKDPQVLKWIASAWFKERSRFNSYHFNDDEFLAFMKKLTRMEIGVPAEDGKYTFLYQEDYNAFARLNYLVYWANHYTDYTWDEQKKYFVNRKENLQAKTREEILFSLLGSKNDSIAFDAFTQLTELDTGRVRILSDDYQKDPLNKNFRIPIFPFRFLRQLSVLTQYCRDNGVEYKPSLWLLDSLTKLETELRYSTRYALENSLINTLSLEEVSQVEYYGLIHQQNWALTYSLGRILDKFYSRNWQKLVSERKQLELYLKKTKLFYELGIIGTCRKYSGKFDNASEHLIDQLKLISASTKDEGIKDIADKIIAASPKISGYIPKTKTTWAGNNRKNKVAGLRSKYRQIKNSSRDQYRKQREIQELVGSINYRQLGEAISILLPDSSMNMYEKFHFIESDFGFPLGIWDTAVIRIFLKNYHDKSKKELYTYYIIETGLDCFYKNGELNFPSIYEILRFDIVDGFAGGGGGRREKGVYLIIKLLEMKFNTTMGFPEKLCNWSGIYGCYSNDRADAWMHFMEEKGLVVPDKAEPRSISNNE